MRGRCSGICSKISTTSPHTGCGFPCACGARPAGGAGTCRRRRCRRWTSPTGPSWSSSLTVTSWPPRDGSSCWRGFPYLGNTPAVRWRESSRAAFENLLRIVLYETLRFRYFPLRVTDLCRAYGLPQHDYVLSTPSELVGVLRRRTTRTPLVYPDPPLGTDERALVTERSPRPGTTPSCARR